MKTQAKEKLRVAAILALNAGFMDGFSFFHFENRFIGAQTGNLIQAGIYLARGEFARFRSFLIPIFFFILGVMTRGFYTYLSEKKPSLDVSLLLLGQFTGISVFAFAYGLGLQLPISLYVGIFSYFLAVQYDTFVKAHGLTYGGIFMSGNMRSFASNLTQFLLTRERQQLRAVRIYAFLILVFFAGAVAATLLGNFLGRWTLMGSSLLLLIVYLIFRQELRKTER